MSQTTGQITTLQTIQEHGYVALDAVLLRLGDTFDPAALDAFNTVRDLLHDGGTQAAFATAVNTFQGALESVVASLGADDLAQLNSAGVDLAYINQNLRSADVLPELHDDHGGSRRTKPPASAAATPPTSAAPTSAAPPAKPPA
jgi:hypothetical protein